MKRTLATALAVVFCLGSSPFAQQVAPSAERQAPSLLDQMTAAVRTMPLAPVAYFKAPAVAQAQASQQKPLWKKPWLYVAIGAAVAVIVIVSSGDDDDPDPQLPGNQT